VVIAFGLLIVSCEPPSIAGSASPSGQTGIAQGYRRVALFDTTTVVSAIAVSESQVFVAQVQQGARLADARSWVVVAPTVGGAAATVAGSESPESVTTNGLAFRNDALYLSRGSPGPPQLNGVFRLAAGQGSAIAGGAGAPTDLSGGNGDGGPATQAAVLGPAAIAFSASGELYIAEPGDSRIRVVRNQIITTYAGGRGCTATSAGASAPAAMTLCNVALLAIAKDGGAYAAPRLGGKWIAHIDASGNVTTVSTAFAVSGLAIDTNGDLLAADSDAGRIVRFVGSVSAQPSVIASGLGEVRALASGSDGSIYLASFASASATAAARWTVSRLLPVP
jgi:hypothetical protein